MRFPHPHTASFVALLLFATIVLPPLYAAQAPTKGKPALPGEPCQTKPLRSWTPQEKWVWQQVCEGKIANFNKAEGYGGNLDPRIPDDWPPNRVLRPAFLETILHHEPYRSALPRHGIRISGAWFRDRIDLSNSILIHQLWLNASRFDSVIDLAHLKTSNVISFERCRFLNNLSVRKARIGDSLVLVGSKVAGKLDMDQVHIEGSLFMRDGAEFNDVVLILANIGGDLDIHGSKVIGRLNMHSLQVKGSLLMRDGGEFAEVNLIGANIAGDLNMAASKFTQKLRLDRVKVGDTLFMNRGAEFAEVVLVGAKIGGNVLMFGSKFRSKLDMRTLQAEMNLFMNNAEFAEAVLVGAKVGNNLSMYGSHFSGGLILRSIRVDNDVVMDDANFRGAVLRGARVGGQLSMLRSKFTRKLNMERLQVDGHLLMHDRAQFAEVNLLNATIGGQLAMVGSTFEGELNMDSLEVKESLFMRDGATFSDVKLTGAKIAGDLDMDQSIFKGKLQMKLVKVQDNIDMHGVKVTSSDQPSLNFAEIGNLDISGSTLPSLDLTGSRIHGEFRLASQKHPKITWNQDSKLILRNTEVGTLHDSQQAWPGNLELEGFTYRGLGGDMATRDISWFEEWLGRQKKYSPQPYEHLASILRKTGHKEKANAVLYAAREDERREATGLDWLSLTLLKVFIGYGYRIYYSLYWSLGFIVLGVLALRVSGQGPAHGMPYGIAYSLDILLPIIRLRERHYEIDLIGWARYYFYLHKLMGYVLASFLIAGLSGLTQ